MNDFPQLTDCQPAFANQQAHNYFNAISDVNQVHVLKRSHSIYGVAFYFFMPEYLL
jgi:hypothetical protein